MERGMLACGTCDRTGMRLLCSLQFRSGLLWQGTSMANKINEVADQKAIVALLANAAAATASSTNGTHNANTDERPLTIALRARVRGEVAIRLRVVDPKYTAEKLARLLNQGNAAWDVGRRARYYQIE